MSNQREEKITAIILLPEYYNPDEYGRRAKVEEYKFKVTGEEITEMMIERYGEGGCMLEWEPKKGFWERKGIIYEDDVIALEIDNFPNTDEDKQWLAQYAQDALCNRFRQEAIMVKFISVVEVLVVDAKKL